VTEVPLSEHNNVVKAFPSDRTDQPFGITILPPRPQRGWPIPNAHRPKAADDDVTVDGVAVTNDVSRCYFPTIAARFPHYAAHLGSKRLREMSNYLAQN
jgi:hypothetical protein